MSRLIVKNLPSYITTDKLRDHFQSSKINGGAVHLTLTDAKVVTLPDGTSRRFGFIGYKSDAEAKKARDWFNRTFIGSARIDVDVVETSHTANPARKARTRRQTISQPSAPDASTSSSPSTSAKSKTQQKFTEVSLAQKVPAWANEPIHEPVIEVVAPLEQQQEEPHAATEISDAEWMRQRMKATTDQSENTEPLPEASIQPEIVQDEEMPQVTVENDSSVDDPSSTILSTSRLFIRNLAFSCTEEELTDHFAPYGKLSQVHLPVDSQSREPKGTAYVTFEQSQSAVDAYRALDKTSFQGRLLHILPAVDRRPKTTGAEVDNNRSTSLKEERELKKKATAGKDFNWGMLYMNADAVAASIADRMNIAKSDILNPESDNAAVKLALAETHVISETKSYLASHGIVLDAFSDKRQRRSDTGILVKNIPYGTTPDIIKDLFSPFGELKRTLVPPAGTMAIIEFSHPEDARNAFKGVAYRRLGNSVIYLEKGPEGMFSAAASTTALEGAKPVIVEDEDGDADLSAGSTLFIKNLAFATTEEKLMSTFSNLAGFRFARIQTKADPNRPGQRLSMGFGFVGFRTKEDAGNAMKGIQGHVIDGHALLVKFAGRGTEEGDVDASGKKKKTTSTTTKMIVKNVPFEASKKDIRDLFSAHGQLKSLRLPKKFDSRTRGFAFIEFLSRQEAENAYAALRHTHLLGRHLVLEWAEEGEDLDSMRKRAGVGFGNGEEAPGKKRKVDMTRINDNDDED